MTLTLFARPFFCAPIFVEANLRHPSTSDGDRERRQSCRRLTVDHAYVIQFVYHNEQRACKMKLGFLTSVCVIGMSVGVVRAQEEQADRIPQAISLLGQPLFAAPPSAKLLARFEKRRANYEANPHDADALIWYARFLAYQGDYLAAIETYTRGIEQFPRDPRMLRHRGHRYITIREFDKAIADLDRATELIAGRPNEIEPDGMPNPQNIPISTLHGNIYYHKGLAHYLQNDLPSALAAYRKCLDLKTNDDNTVSATHWIYMILRRMGNQAEAEQALADINQDMQIIENFSYHRACLFYKGKLSLEEIRQGDGETDSPADDAFRYAIANWHFYNGRIADAQAAFERLVAGDAWSSFGHIAAEADLARMKNHGVNQETTVN